ncbi:AAA family ATPase [Vaccinium witches'-broom phytoplasma]|uniref:AAA family ATPase n=1 Tax=Vaccinium witches'-broom phytoplasma TaxID=85642 RepID=UPI0021C3E9DB|nr:AAA family ATPase [Vaccinium witches'-broom phytoplasma]
MILCLSVLFFFHPHKVFSFRGVPISRALFTINKIRSSFSKIKKTKFIPKNRVTRRNKTFLSSKQETAGMMLNIHDIIPDIDHLLTEMVLNFSEEVVSAVSFVFQEVKQNWQKFITSVPTDNKEFLEKIVFPLYRLHNAVIFHLVMSPQKVRERILPTYNAFLAKNQNLFLPVSVPKITDVYLNPLDHVTFKMQEYLNQRQFIVPNFKINIANPSYNANILSMEKTIPSVYPDVLGVYLHKTFFSLETEEIDIENLSLENSIEEIVVFRSVAFKESSFSWKKDIINHTIEKKLLSRYLEHFVKSEVLPTDGILLYGQRTDDKQKLVELIAKQLKIPFYYVSVDALFLSFQQKKDDSDLNQLASLIPSERSILFVDKMDLFPPEEPFMTRLLTVLKEMQQTRSFLIIGNVNQSKKMQKPFFPACEKLFAIDIPFNLWNLDERYKFIKIKGKKVLKDDLSLMRYIADNTADWEHQDLEHLLDLLSVFNQQTLERKTTLENIQERMHFLKLTRLHPELSWPIYQKNILFHQAGHILVEMVFNPPLGGSSKKEVEKQPPAGPKVCHNCLTVLNSEKGGKNVVWQTDNLIHQIFYSLSGTMAEQTLLDNKYQSFHASEDLQKVKRLIKDLQKHQKPEYKCFLSQITPQEEDEEEYLGILNFFKEQSKILIQANKPLLEEIIHDLENDQPFEREETIPLVLPPSLQENNLFKVNKLETIIHPSKKIDPHPNLSLVSETKEKNISSYQIVVWTMAALIPLLIIYLLKKIFKA